MINILVRLDVNKKVNAQWRIEDDQDEPEPNLINLTNHPDGPNFMGRTQLPDGSFTPEIIPPKTRRQNLKEKPNWTPAEREEATDVVIRGLL